MGAAIMAVAVLAVVYEFERPPALTNVSCRWRQSGVVSAGDISNPSPWSRSFAIEPKFTFQGMGEGTNSMHVYVSVPSHETRHWSVMIDMSRYAGLRITSLYALRIRGQRAGRLSAGHWITFHDCSRLVRLLVSLGVRVGVGA